MQSYRLFRHALLRMKSSNGCSSLKIRRCTRLLCTKNGDESHARKDKFSWMDEAIENNGLREVSGFVDLSDEHWREFEEKGFIAESESVVEKLDHMEAGTTQTTKPAVSEQFLKDFLEFESEDLLEILEIESESTEEVEKGHDGLLDLIEETELDDEDETEEPPLEELEAWVALQEEKERVEKKKQAVSSGRRGLQALVNNDRPLGETTGVWPMPTLGRLPGHTKKPGHEKRVMQMESEMSRVIDRVLAIRYSEWDSSGASIIDTALSPNMRDLTVFYEVAEQKVKTKEFAKMLKRITNGVRSEIAKLDIRYAPRIHFQCTQDRNRAEKGRELDDIFEQIAKDRVADVARVS